MHYPLAESDMTKEQIDCLTKYLLKKGIDPKTVTVQSYDEWYDEQEKLGLPMPPRRPNGPC